MTSNIIECILTEKREDKKMTENEIMEKILELDEQIVAFKVLSDEIKKGNFETLKISFKLEEDKPAKILDEDNSLMRHMDVFHAMMLGIGERDKGKTAETKYKKINPDYAYVFCEMIISELLEEKKALMENLKKKL